MHNPTIESIKKEFIVEASQVTAFEVFTEKIDLWWPRTHHIGRSPMTEFILEPKPNGRWYSRHEDGSEVIIGYVVEWSPYGHLILAWQVNGNFRFDPALVTEVDVHFIPDGPEKTKIKFEHRNLERLGEGNKTSQSMDEGWGQILELYKKECQLK